MSHDLYDHRHYMIFNVSELDQIDFEVVLETSAETVRKSVDETKTFVKWEGDTIPEATATLDEVVLTAKKYAKIFHISEEDINDGLVDVLATYKREWASRWARKYDNACLGVNAGIDGTDVAPYQSLYRQIGGVQSPTNLITTG